jgi:hypothetical protein
MDIALAIEALVPSAEYFGSTTSNTKEDYDLLIWNDERVKPEFTALKAAYDLLVQETQLILGGSN